MHWQTPKKIEEKMEGNAFKNNYNNYAYFLSTPPLLPPLPPFPPKKNKKINNK